MIDKLIIAGRGNCNEDENMEELLEWRIFPTATAQVPQPLEPLRAQRSERDEPQGENLIHFWLTTVVNIDNKPHWSISIVNHCGQYSNSTKRI